MLRNEGIAKASPMSGSMITATVMISVQSKYFRVDRVELPVLLIESFDNVIHRITSCTPAGRRIQPVSTDVSPPRKNMTAFVWARAPVLFLPVLNWVALLQPNFWRSANALHVQSRVRVQRPGH